MTSLALLANQRMNISCKFRQQTLPLEFPLLVTLYQFGFWEASLGNAYLCVQGWNKNVIITSDMSLPRNSLMKVGPSTVTMLRASEEPKSSIAQNQSVGVEIILSIWAKGLCWPSVNPVRFSITSFFSVWLIHRLSLGSSETRTSQRMHHNSPKHPQV